MVSEFSSNGQEFFGFEKFKALYPELSDDFISKSLYLLEDEGLVSVSPADDVAYLTSLNASGIKSVEENTLIKKGYTAIKEIKSLLS